MKNFNEQGYALCKINNIIQKLLPGLDLSEHKRVKLL